VLVVAFHLLARVELELLQPIDGGLKLLDGRLARRHWCAGIAAPDARCCDAHGEMTFHGGSCRLRSRTPQRIRVAQASDDFGGDSPSFRSSKRCRFVMSFSCCTS
jgi:hypothetical protein